MDWRCLSRRVALLSTQKSAMISRVAAVGTLTARLAGTSIAATSAALTAARTFRTFAAACDSAAATTTKESGPEPSATKPPSADSGTGNGNVSGSGNGSDSSSSSSSSSSNRKYSVLPHRTNLTTRLWLDRFDKNNANYKRLRQQLRADQRGSDGGLAVGSSTQRRLVIKRMDDSYVTDTLLFKSNPHVREEYIGFNGGIRMGKLLEDMDAMAGAVAYAHCDDGVTETQAPLTIVTASVDRIDLLGRPSISQDMHISGKVTYVGHSSMEITVSMDGISESGPSAPKDPLLRAKFTMVARDPVTNKAVQVNPLLLETDAERRLFAMGADLKAKKKLQAAMALTKAPPTPEERLVIHDLWLQSNKYVGGALPPDAVWMENTKLQSVQITQPQDRNIHNFIFGGYLMKQGFELAYVTAKQYVRQAVAQSRRQQSPQSAPQQQIVPKFLAMDDIWFRKPVPIGSILHFNSQVVYSRAPISRSFQIMVTADVIDAASGARDTTNVFNFTFCADGVTGSSNNNNNAATAPTTAATTATPATAATADGNATAAGEKPTLVLPRVIPRTYEEGMKYLEGKRKWETGYEMAKENNSSLITEW